MKKKNTTVPRYSFQMHNPSFMNNRPIYLFLNCTDPNRTGFSKKFPHVGTMEKLN